MPVGNMFQCKIDEIFSDMPNVFGIVDNILVIGYNNNGADHDAVVHKVLQRCKEVNLKLNREKCHFRCTSIPFFGEVISRRGVKSNPQKSKSSQTCQSQTTRKSFKPSLELLSILVNFLQVQLMYVIHSTS